MATMIEKKVQSIEKEIAKCESLGCNWSREEWFGGKREEASNDQSLAYFDKYSAEEDLKDAVNHLDNAKARLEKAGKQFEVVKADIEITEKANRIEGVWLTAEERKARYEAWLAEFKAECLKNGVIIEEASSAYVSGIAANGKKFYVDANNGFEMRSRHCYSLRINGEMIFTSGDFETAYRYLIRK